VVGVKRNRMASSGRSGAWGRGAGTGGCGRGLGRLVCFSSEEEADIIAPDVNTHLNTGADATQEQVMPVQPHPHVQPARATAAATSEQSGAISTGCEVRAIIQHVAILFPALRGCDAVCMLRLSCSRRAHAYDHHVHNMPSDL
jgi:glutamine synthetase